MEENNIYARWLRNELTEKEKADLEASGDLPILEKIIAETDSWTLPEMKSNSFQQLMERRNSPKNEAKVISLQRYGWAIGIAASFLLLIVSYFLFLKPTTVTYECNANETLKVILPDQTVVVLNGKSTLAYQRGNWEEDRKVDLQGEGYFEVSRKGPFKVKFDKGEVNVLGTRFNILSGKELVTVKCFEGRVRVDAAHVKNQLLNAGQGVRVYTYQERPDAFDVSSENPDWMKGESVFKDAPLIEIITALSIRFNVEFETGSIDLKRKYSGKFTHADLNNALTMVFSPMGINYSFKEENPKIIILK